MSHLTKTRAIAIRHYPHTETSRIIQWITEDHGKLTTLAKGALRPRNDMLGQVDQLYTCELIYYARERDTLFITHSIHAQQTRSRLRADWRAALAGLYLADLTARIMPEREPAPELFHLLEQMLDELHERGWHAPTLFYFELRLLEALGLPPKLDRCATCNQPFAAGHRAAFATRLGGMVCSSCRNREAVHDAGADILAILAHWQRGRDWNTPRAARCSATQLATIRALTGDFLQYHLDVAGAGRDHTLRMLMS